MGDVFGLAEMAHRDVFSNEGAAGVLGRMQLLEDLLAVDAAGLDGVHRDPFGGHVAGQSLGPQVQRGLGGDRGVQAARLHGAADVDDAAPAALAHAGQQGGGEAAVPR